MLRAILALLFAILYPIIGIPVLLLNGSSENSIVRLLISASSAWCSGHFVSFCLSVAPDLPLSEKKMFQKTSRSLYWQSQELFRYHHHLLTLSAPDRLCSKRFHEKGSSFICLDEQTALSVHQSFGCQRSVKNDPCRNRQYQKRDFDVYFP